MGDEVNKIEGEQQPKSKKQTMDDMEVEMKKLELLAKQLEVEDLKDRVDERKLKREQSKQRSMGNGAALRQQAHDQKNREKRCNHHKGGNGMEGYQGGQGDSPQYSVIKHIFANGDWWIRCLRCAKTWKPPIEADFPTKEAFDQAQREYLEAKNFQTKNQTSASIPLQFSDGGKFFREVMRPVDLR